MQTGKGYYFNPLCLFHFPRLSDMTNSLIVPFILTLIIIWSEESSGDDEKVSKSWDEGMGKPSKAKLPSGYIEEDGIICIADDKWCGSGYDCCSNKCGIDNKCTPRKKGKPNVVDCAGIGGPCKDHMECCSLTCGPHGRCQYSWLRRYGYVALYPPQSLN